MRPICGGSSSTRLADGMNKPTAGMVRPAEAVERGRSLLTTPSIAATRLRLIIDTVQAGDAPAANRDLAATLAGLIAGGDPAVLWFALAVLRAEFPDVAAIEDAQRVARLDGPAAVVRRELAGLRAALWRGSFPRVRVLADAVTVDVSHTASVDFLSGIQRVVRETARRWAAEHDVTLVGWADEYVAFRTLTGDESRRVLGAAPNARSIVRAREVLIPWRGLHVLPELAVERERTRHLAGLARFANTRVTAIGHDCIPVTSGPTVTRGMTSNFAMFLAAMRYSDRIVVTSRASAAEFTGWRRMLRSAGIRGPNLAEVGLPVQAASSTTEDLAEARQRLCLPGAPLVLVVGSHEPRKNHLAVLHACELLWREGLRFNIALVGSGSWKAEPFRAKVAELQGANRPLDSITALPDEQLWAAYRLAHFVLFPSLNEGFGLPAAEALAAGTPVITSRFGSMEQIVAPSGDLLGGLLVDPHDDRSIADAMRTLLTDDEAYARLREQARARDLGSWDRYAAAAWEYLTLGAV
jgi:glycosyltransferase involved in cell wall biosynthesis